MQGLALADCLTAFFTYGFEPFFASIYKEIGSSDAEHFIYVWNNDEYQWKKVHIEEILSLVTVQYPYCLLHYWTSQLGEAFHLVSILLTTCLGVQKLLAVAIPIWSRNKVTVRNSTVVSCTCFIISMVINIPRMFVVSMNSGEEHEEGLCLFSEPQQMLEKYVLSGLPIFLTTLLIFAVVTMLLSTCYIIFTLFRRKRVRGQTSTSMAERKSSILIVCVMVVFLLSEIPRLYLNLIIFSTYKGDLDKKGIVWFAVNDEIDRKLSACYTDLEEDIVKKSIMPILENYVSCETSVADIPYYTKYWIEMSSDVSENIKGYFQSDLKKKIQDQYQDLINTTVSRMYTKRKHIMEKGYMHLYTILNCNNITYMWRDIREKYYVQYYKCEYPAFSTLIKMFPFMILGSASYSESMNYILNIVWGLDITLRELKVLMEILKISTILGCLSNFVIYIAMSTKLREALSSKLGILCLPMKKIGII